MFKLKSMEAVKFLQNVTVISKFLYFKKWNYEFSTKLEYEI